MAPIGNDTINHFTHPAHKLTEIKSNAEYICDGCKLLGNGTRFNCSQCAFDLHEHCAKCPMTLTSDMHQLHPLRLVVHQVSLGARYCHACRKPTEGLVYQCTTNDCSFIVHPGCSHSSSSYDTPKTTTYNNNYYTQEQPQGAPATGSGQARSIPSNIAQHIAVGVATHEVYNVAHQGITSLFKSLFESTDY